jgi:hypothetical protein
LRNILALFFPIDAVSMQNSGDLHEHHPVPLFRELPAAEEDEGRCNVYHDNNKHLQEMEVAHMGAQGYGNGYSGPKPGSDVAYGFQGGITEGAPTPTFSPMGGRRVC